MAQDWIKMRCDLQTHPKVVRILSATQSDKFRVIGGLHAVWSVFDAHSVDGTLKGYTPELLDHVIGWEGFSRAMEAVGWLVFDGEETLSLPEFTEHNGQSAKRRAEDQKRKRDARRCPQSVRDDADKIRTECGLEKRREEYIEEAKASLSPTGDAPPADGVPACPHEAIVALYHEILPANPRIRVWDGARASQLRARWREDPKRQSLDYWRRFFEYIAQSPFLTGRTDGKDGRPFLPGLDWMVKAGNFAKIIEGRYHEREAV